MSRRIPRTKRRATDTAAVNAIWRLLAGREWGVEYLEYVADILAETGRVHPGSIKIEDEDQ